MTWRTLSKYLLATILCVATLCVRLVLDDFVELQRPLTILFLLPVLLAAYLGGGALGSFTTILSAILLLFVTAKWSVAAEVTYVGLFTVVGLLISLVCARLRRSQDVLRATVEQLELAASAANLGILDYDFAAETLYLSPRLRDIAGISASADYTFEQWQQLVHVDDREGVQKKVKQMHSPNTTETHALRFRIVQPSGKAIWVDSWGKALFAGSARGVRPTRWVLVYNDVTEDVLREKSLAGTQRFEFLGRITGQIAHNFNNILAIVSGNLQLYKAQTNPQTLLVDRALQATVLGERLVARLVRIARQRELEITTIDANASIHSLLQVALPTLNPAIKSEVALRANPDRISIDVAEFEAAVINFLENAAQAMPSGGKVTISTSNASYDQPKEWAGGVLMPGNYLKVVVADTGIGMDERTLSRCMEPFFTSKPEGTGLGLSTAVSFAAQSGGMLSIESETGKGTTVTLTLPLEKLPKEVPSSS